MPIFVCGSGIGTRNGQDAVFIYILPSVMPRNVFRLSKSFPILPKKDRHRDGTATVA